jgi:mannitol/fructose-specific phosphotransferase system IIA component
MEVRSVAEATTRPVLTVDAVRLGLTAASKDEVLRRCGEVLVEIGAVSPQYVEAIVERERSVSTYMGEGVAIPHGTDESRVHVRRTALAVLQFPEGVDWGDGVLVRLAIPIAASGDEHVAVLSALAGVLVDPANAERLRTATDPDEVLALLQPSADETDSEEETTR